MNKWIGAMALVGVYGALAVGGCSSSSSPASTGNKCGGGGTGTGAETACDTCKAAACKSAWDSAAAACPKEFACYNGCACTDYMCQAGCYQSATSACTSAVSAADQCESSSCTAECSGGGTPDGGPVVVPDSGPIVVPEGGPVVPAGTCNDLKPCCESIAAPGQKAGCNALVSAANDTNCAAALAGYRAAGTCK